MQNSQGPAAAPRSISESLKGRYPEAGSTWPRYAALSSPHLLGLEELVFELYNRDRDRRAKLGALQDLTMQLVGTLTSGSVSNWSQVRTVFIVDGTGANSLGTLWPLIARYRDAYPLGLICSYRTRGLAAALAQKASGQLAVSDVDRIVPQVISHGGASVRLHHQVLRLLKHSGVTALPYAATHRVRQAALRALLDRAPDLHNLFVANERTHVNALALSSTRGQCRRICVQHGVPMAEYEPLTCDHYWAWDATSANWFARRAPHAGISVTGNPRAPTRLPPVSAISDHRPLHVLFTAQPLGIDFPEPGYLRVIDLVQSLSRKPDVVLTSRLHPADSVSRYPKAYRAWAEAAHKHLLSKHFADALAATDVVLSYASTTLFEAAAAGRHAIVVAPAPCPLPPVELFGSFPIACSIDELDSALTLARGRPREWPTASERVTATFDESTIEGVCSSAVV